MQASGSVSEGLWRETPLMKSSFEENFMAQNGEWH